MTQAEIITTMSQYLKSVDSTTWLSFARFGVKSNMNLLTGRSLSFYRQLGRMVMEDMAENKPSTAPRKTNQLSLFESF